MTEVLNQLERSLNYNFKNQSRLITALTHRSADQNNNERLEYLGDALLGFIIGEFLYQQYPDITEGQLTRMRASLVKGETLAKLARKLSLGEYLKLGSGEMKSGGWRRQSILANTLEAIFGAIYLDSDLNTCRDCILGLYGDVLDSITPENIVKDPKTRLQEYLQSRQFNLPDYRIIAEEGEAHARVFTVQCEIKEMGIIVDAEGRSKRVAEQASAQKILDQLKI